MPDRLAMAAMTMPNVSSKASRASLRDVRMAATAKPNSSVNSFDSLQSEPPTPTWSLRGHGRYPSSTSSVGSTPPCADLLELSASSARLSKLAEEPPEPEDDCIIVEGDSSDLWRCLCDCQPCVHTSSEEDNGAMSPKSPIFGMTDSFFAETGGAVSSRRSSSLARRRSESETNSIASRLTYRFASLSRPWKQRKPVHPIATGYSTPVRDPSSRSSSLSSGALPSFEPHDALLELLANSDPNEPALSGSLSGLADAPSIPLAAADPIDRKALAATPLLPPMIDEAKPAESPLQSPLQSPSVAGSSRASTTLIASPMDEIPPPLSLRSPPLSTKPSNSSLRQMRASPLASPTDGIPPLLIADPNDPWAIKLGHANFTISPEPYLPRAFTADAVLELFNEWADARCNFTKHLHRTGEHFGVTSKTYRLTEEKWAETDAQWKRNYDLVVAEASRNGTDALPLTPEEPAPLMKVPTLNDHKAEGKFPTLGDEDIVGPMTQLPPANPPPKPVTRPRTESLLKLLSNLKIPSNVRRTS